MKCKHENLRPSINALVCIDCHSKFKPGSAWAILSFALTATQKRLDRTEKALTATGKLWKCDECQDWHLRGEDPAFHTDEEMSNVAQALCFNCADELQSDGEPLGADTREVLQRKGWWNFDKGRPGGPAKHWALP